MSCETLKSLFPRRSQCRRIPTFTGLPLSFTCFDTELQRWRAGFLRPHVRRCAHVAVVEVWQPHSLVHTWAARRELEPALVDRRALDAVLLGGAIRVQLAVVE